MALDPVARSLERLPERVRELEDRIEGAPAREREREPVRAVTCRP